MNFILRLIDRVPKGFDRKIMVPYTERLVFEGYVTTGDNLFARDPAKQRPSKPIVAHFFQFRQGGTKYFFRLMDRDRGLTFEPGRRYRVWFDRQLTRCFVPGGGEARVGLDDPDEEEDGEGPG
ncbi:MAG: hypothetical protein KDJ88_22120 [Bauldia sp.]|nr:hypothetical protein [Bauldia sp.]